MKFEFPYDHQKIGWDNWFTQFAGKKKLESFFYSLLQPMVEYDQCQNDLLYKRSIDTAEGVQLDGCGDILAQPRFSVRNGRVVFFGYEGQLDITGYNQARYRRFNESVFGTANYISDTDYRALLNWKVIANYATGNYKDIIDAMRALLPGINRVMLVANPFNEAYSVAVILFTGSTINALFKEDLISFIPVKAGVQVYQFNAEGVSYYTPQSYQQTPNTFGPNPSFPTSKPYRYWATSYRGVNDMRVATPAEAAYDARQPVLTPNKFLSVGGNTQDGFSITKAFGSSITVSCLVRVDGGAGTLRYLLKSGSAETMRGFNLYVDTNDVIKAQFWDGVSANPTTANSGYTPAIGEWILVTVVVTPTGLKLRLNGNAMASPTGTYVPQQSTFEYTLFQGFNGSVARCACTDRELTSYTLHAFEALCVVDSEDALGISRKTIFPTDHLGYY